jgi:hypothetical protein
MKKVAAALVAFVALEHILFLVVQGAPALAVLLLAMLARESNE